VMRLIPTSGGKETLNSQPHVHPCAPFLSEAPKALNRLVPFALFPSTSRGDLLPPLKRGASSSREAHADIGIRPQDPRDGLPLQRRKDWCRPYPNFCSSKTRPLSTPLSRGHYRGLRPFSLIAFKESHYYYFLPKPPTNSQTFFKVRFFHHATLCANAFFWTGEASLFHPPLGALSFPPALQLSYEILPRGLPPQPPAWAMRSCPSSLSASRRKVLPKAPSVVAHSDTKTRLPFHLLHSPSPLTGERR
jgi:hypothetical protein